MNTLIRRGLVRPAILVSIRFAAVSVGLIGLGSLSACSKTNILNSVEVKVSDVAGGDQFITLGAKLNLGNAVLDSLQLPIRDPRTGVVVGNLGLQTGADGRQLVSLGVNASVALHADPLLGRTLPNGRELPLSLGAAPGEVLAFPILQHSRVYIGGDIKTRVIIGVAIGIKALDGVANVAGMPVNLFFGQQVSSQLYGLAGVYGSPVANQSGIAVFGRLQLTPTAASSAIPLALNSLSARSAVGVSAKVSDQATADTEELNARSEQRVTRIFYGGQRRVLRAQ
jgi:hypothetical protein